MIDQEKSDEKTRRTLSFKYNSIGKPVEIEMENVGIINKQNRTSFISTICLIHAK
jgi:hypothetical protein